MQQRPLYGQYRPHGHLPQRLHNNLPLVRDREHYQQQSPAQCSHVPRPQHHPNSTPAKPDASPNNARQRHVLGVIIAAAIITFLYFSQSGNPPLPLPEDVPPPPSAPDIASDIETARIMADICSLELTLASLVPDYEQPPTLFAFLGIDPYIHPFSPPSSAALPGSLRAVAAEKRIRDAWVRLAAATDATYISIDYTDETETEAGAITDFQSIRRKVNLARLSPDAELQRRLLNQVAHRLMDFKFRNMYLGFFMPGADRYHEEVRQGTTDGWVLSRREKLGKTCNWD